MIKQKVSFFVYVTALSLFAVQLTNINLNAFEFQTVSIGEVEHALEPGWTLDAYDCQESFTRWGESGRITIHRAGTPTQINEPLAVNVTVTGTAGPWIDSMQTTLMEWHWYCGGADYELLGPIGNHGSQYQVQFDPGETQVEVEIHPLSDDFFDDGEDVVITLH